VTLSGTGDVGKARRALPVLDNWLTGVPHAATCISCFSALALAA
jgi:hypothetical protein